MKKQLCVMMSIASLLVLSGCGGNVVDWAGVTFNQGESYKKDQTVVKKHMKSIRLYDQLNTIAMFDVLWLSDEMRSLYTDYYCRALGKNEEGKLAFLRRQLSANNYFISFYVLSLNEIPLTLLPPVWVMYLEIGDKKYTPSDVKIAELPFEYRSFFGTLCNNHKTSYEVKFDRKDAAGNDVLAGHDHMKLMFSSADYFGSVTWYFNDAGVVVEPPVVVKVEKPHMQHQLGKRRTKEEKKAMKQTGDEALLETAAILFEI